MTPDVPTNSGKHMCHRYTNDVPFLTGPYDVVRQTEHILKHILLYRAISDRYNCID